MIYDYISVHVTTISGGSRREGFRGYEYKLSEWEFFFIKLKHQIMITFPGKLN